MGLVDWNRKIIAEVPIGSTLTAKKDFILRGEFFGLGDCSIVTDTPTALIKAGTVFKLEGQVAGIQYNKNQNLSGNWLWASGPSGNVAIGCTGSDQKRAASSLADMKALEAAFTVTKPSTIKPASVGTCQTGKWVDAFLALDLGSKAKLKVKAVVDQPTSPGELAILADGIYCSMKPSTLVKDAAIGKGFAAGDTLKIVGQKNNFVMRDRSKLCGTALIVEAPGLNRYALSCVDLNGKGPLVMPQADLQLEAIKKILEI